MFDIRQTPFLKILIPFIVGLVCYRYLANPFVHAIVLWIGVISVSSYIFFRFQKDTLRFERQYWRSLPLYLFIICFGYAISYFNQASNSKLWYGHDVKQSSFYTICIQSSLEEKTKTYKAEASIVSKIANQKETKTHGKIYVYFEKGDSVKNIHQGDIILIKNTLKSILPTGNPNAFEFAKYCEEKGIYHTAYLRKEQWKATGQQKISWRKLTEKGLQFTKQILSIYCTDSISMGIAEALLIGYRYDVDNNIWQAYSDTGIVHIIAISGMHMAMIYATIRYLLLLIPFFKKRKRIALVIAVVCMWLFAVITGLPASVVRAALMFTFIAWAEWKDRPLSIYNTLAASAFILLVINPEWISDVGFQLSYMAVLSIIIFQPLIYHAITIQSWILDKLWAFCSVTLAAQILTFPICIYYFHQFPFLFLITNMVAVPATTIVLYAEIILIFFSWLKPFAIFLGKFCSAIITWLNSVVLYLQKLSFAVWSNLYISLFQVGLIYASLYFLFWAFAKKSSYRLFITLSLLCVLVFTFIFRQHVQQVQKKFIVYHDAKHSYLQWIKGNHYFSFELDTTMSSNQDQYINKPARMFFCFCK
ncbi:MAG: ComEC/Rec2 family competence protein [Chitinophagaceae bacterium]